MATGTARACSVEHGRFSVSVSPPCQFGKDNSVKKKFLVIEAVLCCVPCILLVMGGMPIMFFASIRSVSYDAVAAAWCLLFVMGVIFALSQYVILSLQTVEQKSYRFGFAFWIATAFALSGLWWMENAFRLAVAAVTVGPIVMATLHFIALQIRRRESGPHGVSGGDR